MKKLLIILLSVVLALSMIFMGTGCKETTKETVEEVKETVEEVKETVKETAKETVEEPKIVELEMWDYPWAADWEKASRAHIEKFMKEYPNIKVNYTFITWDIYISALATATATGTAPAFATAAQITFADYLMPLNPVIDEWVAEGKLDISKGAMDTFNFDGQQLAVCWKMDPRAIFYNKKAFDEAGITKLPETFDEFLDVCEKIKQNTDFIPFGINHGTYFQVDNFLNYNSTGVFDASGRNNLKDPKIGEVLEFWNKMVANDYLLKGTMEMSAAEVNDLIVSGKLAMWNAQAPEGVFEPGNEDLLANIGVLKPLIGPSNFEKELRTYSWMNAAGCYKNDHPEESLLLFKWWMDNYKDLMVEAKCYGFPSRESILDLSDPFYSADYWKDVKENTLPYVVGFNWPYPQAHPWYNSAWQSSKMINEFYSEVVSAKRTDYEKIQDKYYKQMQINFEEATQEDLWFIK